MRWGRLRDTRVFGSESGVPVGQAWPTSGRARAGGLSRNAASRARRLLVGILGALMIGLTSLALESETASADVTFNARVQAVRSRVNPCELGTTPIFLTGVFHHVWYTTPDGTLKMNIQGHLKGTHPNGTEYVFITQQHMEHWAWPVMAPYTDTVRLNLISKGSAANALVVLTFDVPAGGPSIPTSSATACVG